MNPDATQSLVMIACAVIGSGAVTSLTSWLLRRIDRHRDLEHVIESSPTIRRLELEIYRQSLFQSTGSRGQHECQLDAGRQYTRLGGNGPGHIRYRQLAEDYRRRLDADDWIYP